MSSATGSTSSNFQTIFNTALAKYTEQTGKVLRNHPLADRIDSCDSPDSILDIFQEQARTFDEFRKGDTKLFKWLEPLVNVLHNLSTNSVFGDGGSFVSPIKFLIIHSLYLNSLSSRRFHRLRRYSSVLGSFYPCVPPLSAPHSSSDSVLPDGQRCEGKIRRSSRYLRMHRELPQTTQGLYRDSAYSRNV